MHSDQNTVEDSDNLAEDALHGKEVNDVTIRETAERCAETTEPNDDIHAAADYKKAMVVVFVQRALRKALERAGD